MAKILGYKHLSGNRVPVKKLLAPASIVEDYVARVAILLEAGVSTEDARRARRHELDALAFCAIIDGQQLEPTEKQKLYHVIRDGFIRAYGVDLVGAKRNGLDRRPYLVELRNAFSIAEDGGVTADEGMVSAAIVDTYTTVYTRGSEAFATAAD